MANTLDDLMPKILARGLKALRQFCMMPRLVNSDYSVEAAKKGKQIDVPIPQPITASPVTPSNTPPVTPDITGDTVPIILDQWQEARFKLSDRDLGDIDANAAFLPMEMEEAVKAIANAVNISIWANYKKVYGYTGTAGTTPFATTTEGATNLRKVLSKQLCPLDLRRVVLDFDAEANALALAPFRDASQSTDKDVIIEGQIGRKFGMDWFVDHHVPTHTAGTITTGLAAKAATNVNAGVKSFLATTAVSTGACALKEGDIINIAGHNTTYALTADATQGTAATDVTLNITPGLEKALVGSEAVTVKASHVVNLGFHRNAFAFANRPLLQSGIDTELGTKMMTMQDPVSKLVMRLEVSREYKQTVWAFDMLWGTNLVRAELAARLAG